MASNKTEIIESIFFDRYDGSTKTLSKPLVTLHEVADAIRVYNKKHETDGKRLSDLNAANFLTDVIRHREGANRNWPASVFAAGFTGRKVTGENLAFEFLPVNPGQTEPFPAPDFATPPADTPIHRVESVSLPLASRRLGRTDEPWMIQVVTRLRIIETHFSLFSSRSIRQLDLLQLNVKLRGTEIDALFLAQEEKPEHLDGDITYDEVIVTCEAKSARDDLVETQIIAQVKGAFEKIKIRQDVVIPMAVKCIPPCTLYLLEFEAIDRNSYKEVDSLIVASTSLFQLEPPVPGICIKARAKSKSRRSKKTKPQIKSQPTAETDATNEAS